jgi:hypothetical protein
MSGLKDSRDHEVADLEALADPADVWLGAVLPVDPSGSCVREPDAAWKPAVEALVVGIVTLTFGNTYC